MSHTFYPFVDESEHFKDQKDKAQETTTDKALHTTSMRPALKVSFPARVAVFDDLAAAPRVVVIDPSDIRDYLEEITEVTSRLAHEQGSHIPFMVIREIVENLIHAYFVEPTISILPGGDTILISDQGPGIQDKERAFEYGTTSATREMKRYIRGVGSGLPYAQHYLADHGGSLTIEDNISRGTVVTICLTQRSSLTLTPPLPLSNDATSAENLMQPYVSSRGKKILDYLSMHEMVGPKELVTAYGSSAATWTRELQALEAQGLVHKQRGGQKRVLTESARILMK